MYKKGFLRKFLKFYYIIYVDLLNRVCINCFKLFWNSICIRLGDILIYSEEFVVEKVFIDFFCFRMGDWFKVLYIEWKFWYF